MFLHHCLPKVTKNCQKKQGPWIESSQSEQYLLLKLKAGADTPVIFFWKMSNPAIPERVLQAWHV